MIRLQKSLLPCILILIAAFSIQLITNNTPNSEVQAQTPVTPITPIPAKARIKGPTTVLTGTLLFLSADDATGDNFKWLIPPELTETSAICNTSIFFAIPTPGTYSFGLVAVNKSADIDVAYHTVIVTSTPGTPPPVIVPPITSFDKLIKTSTEGLSILKDPPTATALKSALELLIKDSENKSLTELRTETVKTTWSVFLNRKGESTKKEWGQLWVEPVDAAIVEINPKDATTYVELLKVLVKTL